TVPVPSTSPVRTGTGPSGPIVRISTSGMRSPTVIGMSCSFRRGRSTTSVDRSDRAGTPRGPPFKRAARAASAHLVGGEPLDAGQREQLLAADLAQEAGAVEVDALVGDAVAVEGEHGDRRHSERPAGRRQAHEL